MVSIQLTCMALFSLPIIMTADDPLPSHPTQPSPVGVSKCCPPGKSLDLTHSKTPFCKITNTKSSPYIAMKGLDMSKMSKEIEIQLIQDQETPISMPACMSDFEVHQVENSESADIRDTWLTVEGKLVTSRYEAEFDHGGFCVDTVEDTASVVAVMCDACKKGVPCIYMCGPHGHALVTNPDYVYDDYDDYDSLEKHYKKKDNLTYSPVLWDHNDLKFLQTWEKNKHFIIVGQKMIHANESVGHSFLCPVEKNDAEFAGLTTAPTDLGTFKILINGNLQGKDLPDYQTGEKVTKIWNSENYCVTFTDPPDYPDKAENNTISTATPKLDNTIDFTEFEFTYMTCHEEKQSWCEKFTNTLHPILLSISIVFLLVTLFVYVCDDSFKTNPLFSKITIGFITNLIICFAALVANNVQDLNGDSRGTFPCILSGYLVLYFFLAFFFWINTMSFNVWFKFTRMTMMPPTRKQEKKKFLKYTCYAQGMPFLIAVITAIIDASATRDGNPDTLIHYPNMGRYSCFLGAVKTEEHQSYFGRPEFIYFQVFLVILQVSNMVFLGITIKFLYQGWENQAELLKNSGKDKEQDMKARFVKLQDQFGVVIRLFVIMGTPWILELISSGLSASHGFDETCWVQLGLDMTNLLAGILIFLVIVAKRPVILNLKKKATELYSGQSSNPDSATKFTAIELNSVSGSGSN